MWSAMQSPAASQQIAASLGKFTGITKFGGVVCALEGRVSERPQQAGNRLMTRSLWNLRKANAVPHLGWNNPIWQYWLESSFGRNGPQGPSGQQMEHESAMCQPAASWVVLTTGWPADGGKWSFSSLWHMRDHIWSVASSFGLVQLRHWHTEVNAAEIHQDDQGLEHLM